MARALLLALLLPLAWGVDRSKFRTCRDTGFCERHREPAAAPAAYSVVGAGAVSADGAAFELQQEGAQAPALLATLRLYADGVARVSVTELDPAAVPRWQPTDVLLEQRPAAVAPVAVAAAAGASTTLGWPGARGALGLTVRVNHAPFSVELLDGEDVAATVNGRGLFHFERQRQREAGDGGDGGGGGGEEPADAHDCQEGHAWGGDACKEITGYWEDGLAIFADGTREEKTYGAGAAADGAADDASLWEESWSGHTDWKKNGPMSVGVDIDFPGASHLYGIPEHASDLALKATTGKGAAYSEPYVERRCCCCCCCCCC